MTSMANDDTSKGKSKNIANWPSEISLYLLNLMVKKHKDGKSGDNGFKQEQWRVIADTVNEKWNTNYNWDQTRTHFRNWKAKLRALTDLQKDSGMGWNEVEQRFCAPLQRWEEFKTKKDARYWKDHPVLPIHREVLVWLSNEISNGIFTHAGTEYPDTVNIGDDMPYLEGDNNEHVSEAPSTETLTSARHRGRPRPGTTGIQQGQGSKKKKSGSEVTSPLKKMAAALKKIADNDRDFAKEINEVVGEFDGFDVVIKMRAKRFLARNKQEANLVLSAPKEERARMVEWYMEEEDSR